MRLEIKSGAIFISDAHFNVGRTEFITFLELIENQTLKTPQLFILGDCFDYLTSNIPYSVLKARKALALIRKISDKLDVFYFEGNHDYNLKTILPNVKVFSLSEQPKVFAYGLQNILLLHGDAFGKTLYMFYSFLIRNPVALRILNYVTLNFIENRFIKNTLSRLMNKKICRKNSDFIDIKRLELQTYIQKYNNLNCIIEGHYHQGVNFKFNEIEYWNIAAFACDKSFFQVQSEKFFKLTEIYLGEASGER